MKKWTLLLICFIAVTVAVAAPVTLNYMESGSRWVIGGSFDVASGGDMDIESGASLKIAGTAITATAAEINASSDIATPGVAEASKAVVLGASKEIATITSATITTLTTEAPSISDTNTTISAFATGGQASATALTGEFNNVTTCATAGDSVKLPTAVAGLNITVKNNGAATLAVFPFSGDSINPLAVNLSIDVAVNSEVTFRAISTTVWETMEVLTLPAPTTQTGNLVIQAAASAGNTNTTITNASQAAARTYTIPDAGASANFVMTEGSFTLGGAMNTPAKIDVLTGGGEVEISSGAIFEIVSGATWTVADGTIPRADLTEDALAKFDVPLSQFTSAVGGTYNGVNLEGGTGSPLIRTAEVDSNTLTETSSFTFRLPENYVAAGDVLFSVSAKYTESGAAAVAGAATDVDVLAFEVDQAAGTVGADICATAAIVTTASYAIKLFTITATDLVAGDLLKVTVTTRTQDTDAGAETISTSLLAPHFQIDVKG